MTKTTERYCVECHWAVWRVATRAHYCHAPERPKSLVTGKLVDPISCEVQRDSTLASSCGRRGRWFLASEAAK